MGVEDQTGWAAADWVFMQKAQDQHFFRYMAVEFFVRSRITICLAFEIRDQTFAYTIGSCIQTLTTDLKSCYYCLPAYI